MSPRKPAARSAAIKKKSSRRHSALPKNSVENVRLFLAADLVTAALTGRREGYAEAIAQSSIMQIQSELDTVSLVAQPDPAIRFTKLDSNDRELPADAQAWCQVRDNKTGLIWCAETLDGSHTWANAKNAAASTRTAGRTDWRLPSIEELLALVDYSRAQPAIDTTYFHAQTGAYWSSTPYASSPSDDAWGVGFDYGYAFYGDQGLTAFVRAVRSVARASQ